jgi:O-acetylhomoserine (thiol)-lyase
MSAEFLTAAALAGSGDNFVTSSALYGGTHTLFDVTLGRFGVEARFINGDEPEAYARSIDAKTKFLYTEIIGNPSGSIPDLDAIAEVARAHNLPLVIDGTFSTPYLCRPMEHGADIVIHSATKFIGGHGNSLGGVVTESGKFDWGSGRFPSMTDPVASYNGLNFWENFGEYAFCTKLRSEQLRDIGAAMSPTNAFLLLQGIETLPFRMDAHVANAKLVVEFLDNHELVSWVNYAGLESSPYFDLAQKYLPKGPGAVFTFGVKGGREAGAHFIESLQLISHLANVGDARTLVIHPASTTHQQLSDENLVSGGVTPDMIRLSIGLEDIEDILWDLDQALQKASL